jgi:hypothetical protein
MRRNARRTAPPAHGKIVRRSTQIALTGLSLLTRRRPAGTRSTTNVPSATTRCGSRQRRRALLGAARRAEQAQAPRPPPTRASTLRKCVLGGCSIMPLARARAAALRGGRTAACGATSSKRAGGRPTPLHLQPHASAPALTPGHLPPHFAHAITPRDALHHASSRPPPRPELPLHPTPPPTLPHPATPAFAHFSTTRPRAPLEFENTVYRARTPLHLQSHHAIRTTCSCTLPSAAPLHLPSRTALAHLTTNLVTCRAVPPH